MGWVRWLGLYNSEVVIGLMMFALMFGVLVLETRWGMR